MTQSEITFKELNNATMLGTKFTVSGSETIYVYDACQLPKNNQFRALNTKYNTVSKIGMMAKLFKAEK